MSPTSPGSPRILRAGALVATYEQGSVRNIHCGSREVLRRIYFAVRDQDWNTVPAKITREEILASENGFDIRLSVEHSAQGIDFRWSGVISGTAERGIRFSVEGEAKCEFLRNRIGLCILHPLEFCAGEACQVEHTDGTLEPSRFPDPVSPHQPFLNVRAISHQPYHGVFLEVRMTGDVFETEDQRNWSDGSFKTYSTPLALPYPALVHSGDRVNQQVEVTIGGNLPLTAAAPRDCVEITLDRENPKPVGAVGTVWDRFAKPDSFAHLRVDVDFSDDSWADTLYAAADCKTPLEIAAFPSDVSRDLAALQSVTQRLRPNIARLMIFPKDDTPSQPDAFTTARELFKGVPIGGGSHTHFAELNRKRDRVESVDFVTWPINPRVHAVDDHTMIENLQGQSPAVSTARGFSGHRPLSISPVLVPEFPASSGWIATSLKHLLTAGISSVTYQTGDSILTQICEFRAAAVIPSRSSNPLIADALVLRNSVGEMAWIANFRAEPQTVRIGDQALTLDAYDVRRIEVG
jgi:D-apionolactonase